MQTTQETVWVVLNCVIFPQSLWKSSVFYQSLTVVVVWFVWRQWLFCLLTSRTFHGLVQSRTQGHLGFLSAVWSLKNDLRENELIQFLDWLMEKRWTPHRKCDFQKGSIDVLTIGFFLPESFNCKLPADAWKTSNQSRCMLQWGEAVFHGTMDCFCSCQRRTSRNKSFY